MNTIYSLTIDGYPRTVSPVTRQPYTLATALEEARGCGGAHIHRSENGGGWKMIVRNAGSDTAVIHEPTGRRIYRRLTRWSATRKFWAAIADGGLSGRRMRSHMDDLVQVAPDAVPDAMIAHAHVVANELRKQEIISRIQPVFVPDPTGAGRARQAWNDGSDTDGF